MPCRPNPTRNQLAGDQADAARTSLIAPSIANFVVMMTESPGGKNWGPVNDVVDVRSSRVEAPRLKTHVRPIGMAPKTFGYRTVVVASFPPGDLTVRNSGSI